MFSFNKLTNRVDIRRILSLMTINIFTLLLIPFSFTAKSIDHAPLSEKHVHFSKNFIEENFKTNGSYDKNKIDIFLGHLYLERENLKDDI